MLSASSAANPSRQMIIGPVHIVAFSPVKRWALRWRAPRPTWFVSMGGFRVTINKPRFMWHGR
jgi:hypothetical protein